jgi:hypothetical protein
LWLKLDVLIEILPAHCGYAISIREHPTPEHEKRTQDDRRHPPERTWKRCNESLWPKINDIQYERDAMSLSKPDSGDP